MKTHKRPGQLLFRQKISSDLPFLIVVVLVSVVFYFTRLGFYSDDWAFLGNFATASNQSFNGLFQSFNSPQTQMRPVQGIYTTLLFILFGTHPLGYHLVNAAMFVVLILLFYKVLRLLNLPRVIALSIPLVYSLLPHYATDRFWYATFAANLSIAAYFLSLYSGIRAIASVLWKKWYWFGISVVSLLISTLSYEVALPLFLVNILIGLQFARKLSHNRLLKYGFIFTQIITLILVIVFKAITTIRLSHGPLENLPGYPLYVAYIIKSALWLNFGVLGLNLPRILVKIFFMYPDPLRIGISVGLGVVIFGYLYTILSRPQELLPNRQWFWKLSLFGLVIFLLGYAIFFVNNNIGFTPTGIGNRVGIAAALGVAIFFVGITGVITSFLTNKKWARICFSFVIATICASGLLIINTLSTFWISAHQQEQQILADIKQHVPILPAHSTLFLDGVCPYIGPGIVFESNWDLAGALKLLHYDETIQADVMTPQPTILENGLKTVKYTKETTYPYGQLFVYNFKTKQMYPIVSAQAARAYFQTSNPDLRNGCPRGVDGHGVAIF